MWRIYTKIEIEDFLDQLIFNLFLFLRMAESSHVIMSVIFSFHMYAKL